MEARPPLNAAPRKGLLRLMLLLVLLVVVLLLVLLLLCSSSSGSTNIRIYIYIYIYINKLHHTRFFCQDERAFLCVGEIRPSESRLGSSLRVAPILPA